MNGSNNSNNIHNAQTTSFHTFQAKKKENKN